MSKEAILKAVREYAAAEPGLLTLRGLEERAGISFSQVYYWFPGGWFEALDALALSARGSRRRPVSDHELLVEFDRVVRELGRLPRWPELKARVTRSTTVYQQRFGKMESVRTAYEKWRRKHRARAADPWRDGRGGVPARAGAGRGRAGVARRTGERRVESGLAGEGAELGRPLGSIGVLHAPTNELGVVHLFGLLGASLGFVVVRVGRGFPDCDAVRRVGGAGASERWERVRIEFEYRSGNFATHGHDPEGCDLIVCWEHDWEACPVEVLELRRVILRESGEGNGGGGARRE